MTLARKIKLVTIIILICVQYTASAQINRPPDRMKMLSAFNGEWKGEMIEMKDKKKIKTKIVHNSMKVAGGWGVQISEAANLPDKTKYVSVKIFSYSATGDTTYMYVVDNKGATYFYTGTWKGTKHLDLKFIAMDEKGKNIKKEVRYDFLSMREYNYKFTSTIGDSITNVIEMNMKKQ